MEGKTKNLEKALCALAETVDIWGLDSRNSKRLLQVLVEMLRTLDKRITDLEARMGD